MRALRLISLLAGIAISLTACVSYAPSADLRGQSRASVLQKLGQPEREYLGDGKKKLQFPAARVPATPVLSKRPFVAPAIAYVAGDYASTLGNEIPALQIA